MKQYFLKFFSFVKSANSEANGTVSSKRWSNEKLVDWYIILGVPIMLIPRLSTLLGVIYLTSLVTLITLFAGASVYKDVKTKDSKAQALPDIPKTD